MNPIQAWIDSVTNSLSGLSTGLGGLLLAIIGALIIFVVGVLIAVLVGRLVEKFINVLKLDDVANRAKVFDKLKNAGLDISISKIVGGLVKWFIILVILMAAADILNLDQVASFIGSIILYIPQIVIAVIILAVAFLLANFVYKVVKGSTKAAGVMSAGVLAAIAKWAIIIFGLLTALSQLGIAVSLINNLLIGFIAALSLAVGLAFGLGGKDEAALILKKLREDLENNGK